METVITYYREGDYLILDLPRRRNRELAFGGEGGSGICNSIGNPSIPECCSVGRSMLILKKSTNRQRKCSIC